MPFFEELNRYWGIISTVLLGLLGYAAFRERTRLRMNEMQTAMGRLEGEVQSLKEEAQQLKSSRGHMKTDLAVIATQLKHQQDILSEIKTMLEKRSNNQ